MRIERVETLLAGRWLFVAIHTEDGLTGVGEVGLHASPEASGAVLDVWAPYLQGKYHKTKMMVMGL